MVVACACAVLGALGLGGCRRGPDTAQVRRDVQQRLERDFKKGLFEVESLARRGHYPYTETGSGKARLAIYYNAVLKLREDYRLSKWDQLNVGSLLSLLGAAKRGIDGVAPKGNSKGDRLVVRGLAAYAAKGDGWRSVAFLPQARKADKDAPRTDKENLPYRKRLKEIGRVAAYFQSHKRANDLEHLNEQLSLAAEAIRRREAKAKGWLSLATGSPAGEYYRQGKALEALLTGAGTETRAFKTKGSIENCRLVAAREVEFAYVQSDIAHAALAGDDPFSGHDPCKDLRAVAALYPEAVQVVVKKGSGLARLANLRGRRINIGPLGSGVRSNALQLLAAAGIHNHELAALGDERSWEALARLKQGQLDAVFLTSAYPNRGLYRFAEKTPVDLLPLSRKTVRALRAKYPYLRSIMLPAHTYPGMARPRRTVHVTAMLVTHRKTSGKRVRTLLELLYNNVDKLSRGSLQAYFISRKTALAGISIPLHPAAKSYLKPAK